MPPRPGSEDCAALASLASTDFEASIEAAPASGELRSFAPRPLAASADGSCEALAEPGATDIPTARLSGELSCAERLEPAETLMADEISDINVPAEAVAASGNAVATAMASMVSLNPCFILNTP